MGAGKGVGVTAPVWKEILRGRLKEGLLVERDRSCPDQAAPISILAAGHPLPDRRSLLAARRCLDLLSRARHGDVVIFFLMGGASSLLALPAAGLALEDKRATTKILLESGMDIREMNCVRKHLSRIKAGGILRAAYPARVITLAISDVIGDDPTVIGSAPSYHDTSTYAEARAVVKKYRLWEKLPANVTAHLLRGLRGEIPETLKPGNPLTARSPFTVLASNRDALMAAKERAEALGLASTILTTELNGDTAARAEELSSFLKQVRAGKRPYRLPHCFLLGGETTVRVRGKGLGGRNQEFALVCALELRGLPGIHLLSAGSDGSDGPTDAAGAFADGETVARAHSLGLDPYRSLSDNDSYRFFRALGDLFSPGPTGTNVLDFKIALVC